MFVTELESECLSIVNSRFVHLFSKIEAMSELVTKGRLVSKNLLKTT